MTRSSTSPGTSATKPASERDRRTRPRAKISQRVRIRSANATIDYFEEVRSTENVSREGLYFTTARDSYYKGMQVFVTCPYSPYTPPAPGEEREATVVRVDKLADGMLGVALQLADGIGSPR